MENILTPAEEVWGYFQIHKTALTSNMYLIASNRDHGMEIYLTERDSMPCICAEADGYNIAQESATDQESCTNLAKKMYELYLTGKYLTDDTSERGTKMTISEGKIDLQKEMITEREEELDDAIMYLIAIATDEEIDSMKDYEDVVSDIKEHVLEYMARKHELQIRRPMFLEDEDGEEFFEEYPYECMIFEDEDNPLYKTQNTTK